MTLGYVLSLCCNLNEIRVFWTFHFLPKPRTRVSKPRCNSNAMHFATLNVSDGHRTQPGHCTHYPPRMHTHLDFQYMDYVTVSSGACVVEERLPNESNERLQ